MTTQITTVRSGNVIIPYTAKSQQPAGTIMAYAGSTSGFDSVSSDGTTLYIKDGWALCNGASISETGYSELKARIGTNWNTCVNPLTGSAYSTPSSGYFRIPDLRGTFLRGVGDFADNTKDTTLAGFQGDQYQAHEHSFVLERGNNLTTYPTRPFGTNDVNSATGTKWTESSDGNAGSETRPQNVGVNYLIKLHDNVAYADVYIPFGQTGMPGEVISSTVSSVSATSAGVTAVAASLSLTAGTWLISGGLSFYNAVTPSAGVSEPGIDIYNSTDASTISIKQYCGQYSSNSADPNNTGDGFAQTMGFVSITGSKTIQLRLRNDGGTNGTITSRASTTKEFFAVRLAP